jgi:uncharacterized protein with PQ loop repeat
MHLLLEALIVGFTTVVAFSLIYVPIRVIHTKYSQSITAILLTAFATGAMIHLGYEALGWNDAFCTYRAKQK